SSATANDRVCSWRFLQRVYNILWSSTFFIAICMFFSRKSSRGGSENGGTRRNGGNFESDIATAGKLLRHDQQSPLPQYSITPPLPPELPSQHNNFPKSVLK